MRMWRHSLKELKNNRRFCVLFILNLSLGLSGLLTIEGFKMSLDQKVKAQSRQVLGGDFGVTARRPLTDDELRAIESNIQGEFKKIEVVEVFSMVAGQDRRSRLVQIKAISSGFPFYGAIDLSDYGSADQQAFDQLHKDGGVWVYPELQKQLNLSTGDELYIGESTFRVKSFVRSDAAAGVTTNLAPRIYMSLEGLYGTGLIRKGSIAYYNIIYYLPQMTDPEIRALRLKSFALIDNPDVRIITHETASENTTLLISRLNDFLGLTSLVGLFLAAIGASFLYRSYFLGRRRQVATLLALGASRTQAFFYYLLQLLVLGLVSALLSALLALILAPALARLTQSFVPIEFEFSLPWSMVLIALGLGTVGSALIALPMLAGLKNIKPAQLLMGEHSGLSTNHWLSWMAIVPGVLFFWWLTVWFAKSYYVGSFFSLAFVIAIVVLSLFSMSFFYLVHRWTRFNNLSLRWAVRDLSRHRVISLVCFVCIGLGTLLLNLIPQVQKSISTELQQPERSKVPSLFMFDIQEDQLDDLRGILTEQGIKLDQISPTIQARLVTVNEVEFDKGKGAEQSRTREEEREMRFRNRGFNLSYRPQLSESESIVAGRPFRGPFDPQIDKVAEISMEVRFAKRLGLKLGDRLVFDVEGVPVEGEVINLRSVRWASFQPNFFVQFQPGVLDLAPKTYIATAPSLTLEQKLELQDRLVESLPNISMVDIGRVVEQLAQIIEQMSWALILMSFLCLFAGFIVLYSIANHQANRRRWDIGLLKSLGMGYRSIKATFVWQYSILGFVASLVGATLSLVFSFTLSYFLFDGLWIFDWQQPLLTVIVATVLTMVVSEIAIRQSLRANAIELFSSQ
jgi:putative ABC transport system permease protein